MKNLLILVCLALCSGLSLAAQDARRPSLVVDSRGAPSVAWVERTSKSYEAFVKKWDGGQWVSLGRSLTLDPDTSTDYVSLTAGPQDQLAAAWTENQFGRKNAHGYVHVAKWAGASWEQFGKSPSLSETTGSDLPLLKLDSKGNPLLFWSEIAADFNVDRVHFARWEAGAWVIVDVGSLSTDTSSSARSRDFVVDSKDDPILAWSQLIDFHQDFNVFVGPWDGQHWDRSRGSLNINEKRYAAAPVLALDRTGKEVVAFLQAAKGFDLWVKRWDGSQWKTLGGKLNDTIGGARNPRIALGPDDQPVVAFANNQGSDQLLVKHWDGSQWVALGSVLNHDPQADVLSYDMRLDPQGRPLVVWSEMGKDYAHLYFESWDGKGWVEWASPAAP